MTPDITSNPTEIQWQRYPGRWQPEQLCPCFYLKTTLKSIHWPGCVFIKALIISCSFCKGFFYKYKSNYIRYEEGVKGGGGGGGGGGLKYNRLVTVQHIRYQLTFEAMYKSMFLFMYLLSTFHGVIPNYVSSVISARYFAHIFLNKGLMIMGRVASAMIMFTVDICELIW